MFHRALFASLACLVFAGSAMAATHQVQQVGITFVPADLTIEVGDTVEWIWSAGGHTVTQGTDELSPPLLEKLFDEPLALATPMVSFTFTNPGDVDYFCRPHLIFDMIGIIRVEQPTPASEQVQFTAWSRVKNMYR